MVPNGAATPHCGSEMSEYHSDSEHGLPEEEHSDFGPEALDLLERAWEAFEIDEVEQAVILFQEARDAEPDNHAIDAELAEALFELGRHAEVVGLCRTVLESEPDAPRVRRLMALALHEKGDHAEALPLVQEEIADHPDDALLHVTLGDVLGALKRDDEAIEVYRQALELDPAAWGSHHGWGMCLARQENFAAAIDHYRAALTIDENLPEVWLAWGELNITLHRWHEAREKLLRAVQLDEQYAEAWEGLSYVCDHIGDPEEALATLRRAVFWNSEQEELLDHLAKTYHSHLDIARSWEITLTGQYLFPDAVPPERSESHRFRRTYQVWAPDEQSALAFIEEIEGSMWPFRCAVEEILPGPLARDCHGGVVYISERLYESALPGR